MKKFNQTWRWFGPQDPVSLQDIKQAGAAGIVSALHHIPNGEVWEVSEIQKHKNSIENAGLIWSVVESIPVHEDIKLKKGNVHKYISNYKQSIINLASCGVRIVTYNFMPILDWTRTNLSYELPNGSKALYFDQIDIVMFDCFILNRSHRIKDYPEDWIQKAKIKFDSSNESYIANLTANIIAGLPGAEEGYTIQQFNQALDDYKDITAEILQQNLIDFVKEITPIAEQNNVVLAIHPDDPPFPIFGLPRVVSTQDQIEKLLSSVPSKANGICFCTGSFGVREDNNLLEIINSCGDRIHFAHLRSTKRTNDHDFYEAEHLDGDVDMVSVINALINVNQTKNFSLPIRPDHGHQMMDDITKKVNPGYSAIGRLKGLAEIRGIELALTISKI